MVIMLLGVGGSAGKGLPGFYYWICVLVQCVFHFVHVPVNLLQYKCPFEKKKKMSEIHPGKSGQSRSIFGGVWLIGAY